MHCPEPAIIAIISGSIASFIADQAVAFINGEDGDVGHVFEAPTQSIYPALGRTFFERELTQADELADECLDEGHL